MNLFSSLFGASENQHSNSEIKWIDLTSHSQIDEMVSGSTRQPQLIFKHSTRCAISRMALKDFERHFKLDDQIGCYFLDLLSHRELSNEIASRFGVVHQSPQLLVIKNGKCIYDVSHGAIDAAILDDFIE